MKVVARKSSVLAFRLVKHRDVRLDALFVDEPCEHLSRSVAGVGRETLRLQAKRLRGSSDHRLGRRDFRLAHGGGGLDVDDDRALEVDQIVVAIGVAGRTASGRSPARGGIDRRDEFRCDVGRGTERGIVEHRQILVQGASGVLRVKLRGCGYAMLTMGIGAIMLASTAKPSPPTMPSAMHRRTLASNSLRSRSLSRKRPCRCLDGASYCENA